MNNTQRILLAIYLLFTLLVTTLDHLFPGADVVQYVKFATMASLFISVLVMRKHCREQKVLTLAFFFMVIADSFSVFSTALHSLSWNLKPLGAGGFLLAYLCLIYVYQKHFKIAWTELIVAVPIAAVYLTALLLLRHYVDGTVFTATAVFGAVLGWMTWNGLCTIFRNYYSMKVSCLIAISASLMLVSDLAVAVSFFDPQYSGTFIPWLKNIVWGAYIPAWTLLAAVAAEENPLMRSGADSKNPLRNPPTL